MGQQQLLLVILVTIIVGIATVVAINVFGSGAEQANRDAVRSDMLTIATGAEGFYIKPQMMGGGSNSYTNFTLREVSGLPALNMSADGLTAWNENGKYVATVGAQQIVITGHPASAISGGIVVDTAPADAGDATKQLIATVTRNETTNNAEIGWTAGVAGE